MNNYQQRLHVRPETHVSEKEVQPHHRSPTGHQGNHSCAKDGWQALQESRRWQKSAFRLNVLFCFLAAGVTLDAAKLHTWILTNPFYF